MKTLAPSVGAHQNKCDEISCSGNGLDLLEILLDQIYPGKIFPGKFAHNTVFIIFQMMNMIRNLDDTVTRLHYRTRSKSSPTLNFVRQKSSVQADSNCDKFPISLIPVIHL